MNDLIKQNCKRCINYEICQSTGCAVKTNIIELQQVNQQLKENNQSMQEEMARTWEKLQHRDEVIDEILRFDIFENDCPCSMYNEELDCCENCQDDFKQCWLKYFENKYKGDNNG